MSTALAPSDPLAAYAHAAEEKERRVRQVLAAEGFEHCFQGMRRTPLAAGYRMRASIYLDPAGALGVDPRLGRRPLEETLWVLPEEVRPLAVSAAQRLAAAPAGAGATGLELRLEFGSLRAHLTLGARRGAEERLDALAGELLAELPGVLGVAVPSQSIRAGESHLAHRLLDTTLLAHHLAFFQTNRALTPALAAAARQAAHAPASIVDLYCGVGLHSLLAAEADTRVLGVDSNRWAIESACRNAQLQRLPNARYERITVERLVGRPEVKAPSLVYVNPSRHGCAPGVVQRLCAWGAERVCLVSCSIESHARDLASFRQAGYRAEPFECFDMFPFSPFVESVTVLRPG